jgi:acetylornithine deacetylase/succinyl-diaminopimelate desuccinylase-like protein
MSASPIRRRERAAARLALYTSLVLTVAAAGLLVAELDRRMSTRPPEWSRRDYSREPAVQRLQELVRIDTTGATGREIEAARYLSDELRGMGLSPVVEELIEGKANLWAVVEGRSREALVLHSHLDTDDVPDAESWSHPPFAGEIEGPWIYGRGAYDMKSLTVAQLEAMRAVQEQVRATGRRPARSLVFLATSSEETGSDLGARWIVEQHPELVDRFWALLTEGGVIEATAEQRIKYWGISFAQKSFVRFVACSSSARQLDQLREALAEHQSYRRVLAPEVRSFLSSYGPTREELLLRERASDPENAVYNVWTFRFLPPYLRALYRNEVHTLGVESDPASGTHTLPIVLHLVPGESLERARRELLPDWMMHGIRWVEVEPPLPDPHGSPLDHPAFLGLAAAVNARYPEATVGPYVLTLYDNDARFFRGAGVPSYGFSPFVAYTPDSFTVGGTDERITLLAFLDGVALYRDAVLALLEAEPDDEN